MADYYLIDDEQLKKLETYIGKMMNPTEMNKASYLGGKLIYEIRNPPKKKRVSSVTIDKLKEAFEAKDVLAVDQCWTNIKTELDLRWLKQQIHEMIDSMDNPNQIKELRRFYDQQKQMEAELKKDVSKIRIKRNLSRSK